MRKEKIAQLYIVLGAWGIRLYDISSRSISLLNFFPRYPLTATRVARSRAKRSRVRINDMTWQYCSFVLWDIFSASRLFSTSHSFAMPPVVEKTSGVNEAFSVCSTLLFVFSFLLFFMVFVDLCECFFKFVAPFGYVTLYK